MMWVFGYGSLIWKFNFPFEEALVGYIKGYERKFYQLCTDHRGTPQQPGRVVTLVPSNNPENRVFGLAHKVKTEEEEATMQNLDQREHCGYKRRLMQFHPRDDEERPMDVLVYVADESNPQYAGASSMEEIVADVLKSSGPSGTNIDYVKNLAEALRNMAPDIDDKHVFEIERRITEHFKELQHTNLIEGVN